LTIGIRPRQFNNFSGSIDSAGGIPNENIAKMVIALMANPKLAKEMVSQYSVGHFCIFDRNF